MSTGTSFCETFVVTTGCAPPPRPPRPRPPPPLGVPSAAVLLQPTATSDTARHTKAAWANRRTARELREIDLITNRLQRIGWTGRARVVKDTREKGSLFTCLCRQF